MTGGLQRDRRGLTSRGEGARSERSAHQKRARAHHHRERPPPQGAHIHMLCAQARRYQAFRRCSDPLALVLPATTGALVALSSNGIGEPSTTLRTRFSSRNATEGGESTRRPRVNLHSTVTSADCSDDRQRGALSACRLAGKHKRAESDRPCAPSALAALVIAFVATPARPG
jgi:hypothetical protein